MVQLPHGTVAFLFTDIEGSTRLWREHPEAMRAAYMRHDAILRGAIAQHHGVIYKVIGDAVQAAFPSVAAATHAATQAQIALVAEPWARFQLPQPLRVRMAVHVGDVDPDQDGDYRSPVLNRAGRLLGAGHGGQVLLSRAVVAALDNVLPTGATLRDLGEHLLKDLEPEPIWQLLHTDLPVDFPPLAAPRPENLPLPPTPLIGREPEVAHVTDLVTREDVRVVTLLGPGGIGKTRLALAVARAALPGFGAGAFFVPLAALRDPDLLPATVAAALGIAEDPGVPLATTLREHLRDRQLLLVLDNAEQIVERVADFTADLLATCPRLTLLVTSRAPLRIRAERVVPVEPLAAPATAALRAPLSPEAAQHFPAVRLFVDRAQAVEPGFVLDAVTAPHVGTICTRLDGIPLALELAAAWIPSFSPEALVAQLTRRLPLLTDGPRDLPARQQTLRSTIAWSYDLLKEADRALLRRVAVFAGGAPSTAIETVSNAAENLGGRARISSLVEQSLVRQENLGDSIRFSMLETIREFGLERLTDAGEDDITRHAHAAWLLGVTEECPDEQTFFATLNPERDNLRAALDWTLDHEPDTTLLLAAKLGHFWYERAEYGEAYDWLRRIAESTESAPAALRHVPLYWLGWFSMLLGHYDEAEFWFQTSLAMTREGGYPRATADALYGLGSVATDKCDHVTAAEFFREANEISRNLGDRPMMLHGLNSLGLSAFSQGHFPEAIRLYEEALALSRELEDVHYTARILRNLGEVLRAEGKLEKAASSFAESLTMCSTSNDALGSAGCLQLLAGTFAERHDGLRAARLFGAAKAQFDALGVDGVDPPMRPGYEQDVTRARDQLGEEVFVTAWEAGYHLPLDQAVVEALEAAAAFDLQSAEESLASQAR